MRSVGVQVLQRLPPNDGTHSVAMEHNPSKQQPKIAQKKSSASIAAGGGGEKQRTTEITIITPSAAAAREASYDDVTSRIFSASCLMTLFVSGYFFLHVMLRDNGWPRERAQRSQRIAHTVHLSCATCGNDTYSCSVPDVMSSVMRTMRSLPIENAE